MPSHDKRPGSQFLTRPLYLQLHDMLAKRITEGEWKPGTPIPNEADLAREAGVSAGTLRKALDLLASEHLVTRRQGRGTFVNDPADDAQALRFTNIRGSDGKRIVDSVASNSIVEAEATEAEREHLRLQPHDRVHRIRRVRVFKGRPFMVEETAMPAALFPGLAARENFSQRASVLLGEFGLLPGRAEERVSIGSATPSVAAALGVAQDDPVMVLDRVVYTLDDAPVEWRVAYCHLVDEYYLAEMA